MICAQVFYSIAGKAPSENINHALTRLLENKATPERTRTNLKYILACAGKGSYPGVAYFKREYELREVVPYDTEAEVLSGIDRVIKTYEKFYYSRNLIEVSNVADTSEEILDMAQKAVDEMLEDFASTDYPRFKPLTMEDFDNPPEGIKLGLPSLDRLTGGFIPGSVASVAAFSGGGKTTFWLNTAYNNALKGKKVVYVSLEMSPEVLWETLLAKYAIDTGVCPSLIIQNLKRRKLPEEQKLKVLECQKDFDEKFRSNLLIIDEGHVSRTVLASSASVKRLYKNLDNILGGLDLVIWDHVHQLELMNPKQGEAILRNIASATKLYTSSQGVHPVCGWACQVNREGYKESKRYSGGNGKPYDLTAIGDLNEVIRSSSYILFLRQGTGDDDRQGLQLRISMPKHRYGPPLADEIIFNFKPEQLVIEDKLKDEDEVPDKALEKAFEITISEEFERAWNLSKKGRKGNQRTLDPFAGKEGSGEKDQQDFDADESDAGEEEAPESPPEQKQEVTIKQPYIAPPASYSKTSKRKITTTKQEKPDTTTQGIAVRIIQQFGPLSRKAFKKLFRERCSCKTSLTRLFYNWTLVHCVGNTVCLKI